jgi:hypothetical protein
VVLRTGQAVPWPYSPTGFAQIVELRRTKVRVFYRTKNGHPRHALAPAGEVCRQQLLFELDNPYNRGLIRKSKAFEV